MKQSRLASPSPLRNSRASASVVERCVSFERFSPWKSRSPLRPGAGGVPEPSFGRKLFGLAQDQRAVDREVLVRKQPFDLRVVEHGGEELRRDLAAQQPVAVLGEYGDIPNRIVDAEANEPAEQQIVIELLHQLPLGTHRIERLQQQRPQQLLRRDRRPADRRIDRREVVVEPRQCLAHHRPDRSQRMGARHPRLQIHIAEQAARPNLATAHRYLLPIPVVSNHATTSKSSHFSAAC
jgi:hypothetical protein